MRTAATPMSPADEAREDYETAQAEHDAKVAAQALRDFADTRGVNVGDEDTDWWKGYRQAQRECLHDAVQRAERIEAGDLQ